MQILRVCLRIAHFHRQCPLFGRWNLVLEGWVLRRRTHTKCKSMFHGLIRPKSFVGTDSFDLAEHALAQRPERGKGDYCRKKGIVYWHVLWKMNYCVWTCQNDLKWNRCKRILTNQAEHNWELLIMPRRPKEAHLFKLVLGKKRGSAFPAELCNLVMSAGDR